jgi:hypothetical protein
VTDPTWYSDWLPLTLSALALVLSGFTAWQTLFRRGTVKATRPTQIFFGPDGRDFGGKPKIYLRFLLYSTSPKGCVIESLFLRVRTAESVQVFPIWVFGVNELSRGTGMFVGPEGVAANHHFLLPSKSHQFKFHEGRYHLEIVGRLVATETDLILGNVELTLSERLAKSLLGPSTGVYFDWGGENNDYSSEEDNRLGNND